MFKYLSRVIKGWSAILSIIKIFIDLEKHLKIMKNVTYVGNCNDLVDLDSLVNQVSLSKGSARNGNQPYSPSMNLSERLKKEFEKMNNTWKKAGYLDLNNFVYTIYRPDTDFDNLYISKISESLNITPLNVWISSLTPGCCVPYHTDLEQNEDQWSTLGTLVRYTVFIDEPKIGHIFLIDKDCFHMIERGSIFKWNNWKEYHIGMNCGLERKYMLHIVGVANETLQGVIGI
jgi:hypothetical protein